VAKIDNRHLAVTKYSAIMVWSQNWMWS